MLGDPAFLEELFDRVEFLDSDCWIWDGDPDHYGHTGYLVKAHRRSYEVFWGPIPVGMLVCHRCDVRGCVNPNHLVLGTPADNSHDMHAKGRAYKQKAPNPRWTRL